MTLTDAGALVALLDKNQPQNTRCRTDFASLSLPLLTTWPAFAEAMYLVHRVGGWPLQHNLWTYVEEGVLQLHAPTKAQQKRMQQLMAQYHDTPMDLADASLVISFAIFDVVLKLTTEAKYHGNIDSVKIRLSTKTSTLDGGYHRGHLLGLIIWYRFNDIISRLF